ncbi:hypothetical protein QF034_006092 [Streptomyces africanus]|uniref:Transposase n=1 Tax=Streptomyces africanus TaxID=231024 RepID=A0ABU0QWU6_9ACTN|nr:hypothetical protein [Streptomyces africanus]
MHDLREIVNASLYVNRTGLPWEYLPYQNSIFNHGAALGIDVEVVQRPRTKGSEPLPTIRSLRQALGT